MEEVNALALRTKFGEILDLLEKKGEPILIKKRHKLRAVLVTPEQFEKRFLDWQAEEKQKELLSLIKKLRKQRTGAEKSLDVLRRLRGYDR
jgi:PHD/YefM family antitoxin component YafN of YafNO toxin-antitoxin module